MFFLKGDLPWGIFKNTKNEEVLNQKMNFLTLPQCKDLPSKIHLLILFLESF